MATLDERFQQLEQTMQKPSFRENKGLGNEVGYYVFDYRAEDELQVREHIKYLANKYQDFTYGFELKVYDLYDMIIDILTVVQTIHIKI